jgi:hypothetical protein
MLLQHREVPDCPIYVLCVVCDVALACSALLVAQAVHVKAGNTQSSSSSKTQLKGGL